MLTWSTTLYTEAINGFVFPEYRYIMAIFQHTINTPYMVGPVHCYTTEVNGELVLFDTGPPTSSAEHYHTKHIDLASLKYVFITHCHFLKNWALTPHTLKNFTKALTTAVLSPRFPRVLI